MELFPVMANAAPNNAVAATAPVGAGGALTPASDFETFLTLLTTQLQNQDPLKPLESTEFVAQLASFSAVEQQVRTNDALSRIQELLGGSPVSTLASWIGMEVRALRDATFDGTPVDVFAAPVEGADRADLVVRNPAGDVVQRMPVGQNDAVVQWTGTTIAGTPFASGRYRFEVESFQNGTLIRSEQAPVYGEVTEARLENGATMLVFSDGSQLPSDQVTAIRNPTGADRPV